MYKSRDYCTPPLRGLHAIPGDGNCQFAALSYASFGTPGRHRAIRTTVCDYIEKNWDDYRESVTQENYVQHMRKGGTWGDHVTLDAFCNAYGVQVMVLRDSGPPTLCQPKDMADDAKDCKIIAYHGSHYNAYDPWYSTATSKYICSAIKQ